MIVKRRRAKIVEKGDMGVFDWKDSDEIEIDSFSMRTTHDGRMELVGQTEAHGVVEYPGTYLEAPIMISYHHERLQIIGIEAGTNRGVSWEMNCRETIQDRDKRTCNDCKSGDNCIQRNYGVCSAFRKKN